MVSVRGAGTMEAHFDVIAIGAGLSGLTAASLLAKRGLKVGVVDKSYNPGGSCGTFKRDGVIFDQGSAMLFGFGERGFNPHRFVFNCLEEPIDVIKHDLLYCVNYAGHRVKFWADVDKFADELGELFPSQKRNIKRFYRDLSVLYQHVIAENPVFSTPDEMDPRGSLKSVIRHPFSYAKFLSFMNKSASDLLSAYFTDPAIFSFFDKLTSTYCYATVEEAPAVMAAVMFVDNHVGGSYYPAGSTVFLPGKLEKVIEENGGEMIMQSEVSKIVFENGKPTGVELTTGDRLHAANIVYSGTVWNLFGKLIPSEYVSSERVEFAKRLVPTYPSVVLYAHVGKEAIPEGTAPIEMLVGKSESIDESEVTAYIFSIDDRTLAPAGTHVVMAIGPTFTSWDVDSGAEYKQKKESERIRLLSVLENRFPGFTAAVRHSEVATPVTIERYTNKNGGAVAGPKQMMGQHILNRLHTRTEWDSLYCCGESTVMGTGTPTVTISGLAAANAILKKLGMKPFVFEPNMKDYVRELKPPFEREDLYSDCPEATRAVMLKAAQCQYCEHPACMRGTQLDVRGIMRRVTVGNITGARRLVERAGLDNGQSEQVLAGCEARCIQMARHGRPVEIRRVVEYLTHTQQ